MTKRIKGLVAWTPERASTSFLEGSNPSETTNLKPCSVCKDLTRYRGKCKKCQAIYVREHYKNNKVRYKELARQKVEKLKELLRSLKDNKPCCDCKKVHRFFALDFDHRDPKKKMFNVGDLVRWGSKKLLLAEIKKCDLVCANCHRYRTYKHLEDQSAGTLTPP